MIVVVTVPSLGDSMWFTKFTADLRLTDELVEQITEFEQELVALQQRATLVPDKARSGLSYDTWRPRSFHYAVSRPEGKEQAEQFAQLKADWLQLRKKYELAARLIDLVADGVFNWETKHFTEMKARHNARQEYASMFPDGDPMG